MAFEFVLPFVTIVEVVLYRVRNKAKYWLEIAIFHSPCKLTTSRGKRFE